MSKVLFTSRRPLGRCENITAVYDAYDGEKDFILENWRNPSPRIFSGGYSLMVADEFCPWSPGKSILIGHGISGGKSYGLLQPNPYHTAKNARLIDYVVCTSEATISLEAMQSGVPDSRVLPLGMPRTDAYFGKKKGDGGTFLAGKRAYLFAPTFRNPHEPPMPEYDWKLIDSMLTDDEVFVVKPHMVTEHILEGKYRHVVEASAMEPSGPYLIDCDVLITDYSTIMLDAHILKKPVILFEKEPGFVGRRGLWLPYPDGYASRYCTMECELIQRARAANGQRELDILCRERTAGACDGHSTERVVNLIRSIA
ncbi:MAG: CDP-glycerol glycerophosphotransferase family protein [Eubacteriales bacterium]|nr:CDP-glycerol glycerophosphotransferase family protein [Eubacteriales bacterium]